MRHSLVLNYTSPILTMVCSLAFSVSRMPQVGQFFFFLLLKLFLTKRKHLKISNCFFMKSYQSRSLMSILLIGLNDIIVWFILWRLTPPSTLLLSQEIVWTSFITSLLKVLPFGRELACSHTHPSHKDPCKQTSSRPR